MKPKEKNIFSHIWNSFQFQILTNVNSLDAVVLMESVSTQMVLFTVSANRVSQFLQMAVHVKVR